MSSEWCWATSVSRGSVVSCGQWLRARRVLTSATRRVCGRGCARGAGLGEAAGAVVDGEALGAAVLAVGDGVGVGVGEADGVAAVVTGPGAGSCVVPPSARGAGGAGAEGHRSTAMETTAAPAATSPAALPAENAAGATAGATAAAACRPPSYNGTTRASPESSPSGGTSPELPAEQEAQPRMCRAMRLRHSGVGAPSQSATRSARKGQRSSAASARTTARPTSSWFFTRWTRTAACWGESPRASASSARVSSPVVSSHQSESTSRSASSSQRVASAVSRRWPESSSRRMVRSTKSAAGSAGSSVSSRAAGRWPRTAQRVRTWFMAMATSQDRNRVGSRSEESPESARSMVSCTTSSTSGCPLRARPTTL